MKRKQAVQKVQAAVDSIYTIQSIEAQEPLELASELLARIEAIMLPPLNKDGVELYYTSDHDSRNIGYVKQFLKWDE